MKKTLKIFGIFTILVLFSSCATIIKGSKENVSVNSNPERAKITITEATGNTIVFQGVTPSSFQLPKNNKYLATIELEGYQPAKIYISQELEAWFCGNIICGGLIGIIVDYATGAMWKLNPNTINVNLTTAMVDGEEKLFTMFYAKDDKGQLRYMSVPLIKK